MPTLQSHTADFHKASPQSVGRKVWKMDLVSVDLGASEVCQDMCRARKVYWYGELAKSKAPVPVLL